MIRGHAVVWFAVTMCLAAIIAAIPVTRIFAQDAPATAGPTPGAGPPVTPDAAAASTRQVDDEAAPTTPMTPATPATTAAAPPPARMVASLSHELQFGLAVLLGDGYRGIFPYETMIDCGDAKSNDSRVCTNRAPVFLDVQPSFGLSERWDFLVDLRFGLTRDFNTFHQFFVMPGFKYWLDPQRRVKFFTTIQLAYDRSGQNNPPYAPHAVSENDLGFRNSNGLMFEVMRNFGVFFQFGETVGFYRWLSFTADAGIGVQARFP